MFWVAVQMHRTLTHLSAVAMLRHGWQPKQWHAPTTAAVTMMYAATTNVPSACHALYS